MPPMDTTTAGWPVNRVAFAASAGQKQRRRIPADCGCVVRHSHDMSATRFLAALSAADDPAHGRANTGVSMIESDLSWLCWGWFSVFYPRRADGDHARR